MNSRPEPAVDAKPGLSIEARLGMCVVVILLCAFGFLVYRKFDARQKHLLSMAATNGESQDDAAAGADDTATAGLQQPVATRLAAFEPDDVDPFEIREVSVAEPVTVASPDSQDFAQYSSNLLDTGSTDEFSDEPPFSGFDEPAVETSVLIADADNGADNGRAQNEDPFETSAPNHSAPHGLFEDFAGSNAGSHREHEPAPAGTDWADGSGFDSDLAARTAARDTVAGVEEHSAPFAFAEREEHQPHKTHPSPPSDDAIPEFAFDVAQNDRNAAVPHHKHAPDNFDTDSEPSEILSTVDDPSPLRAIDDDGFDDFTAAAPHVHEATEVAMLQLPDPPQGADVAEPGQTTDPPSLTIEGFADFENDDTDTSTTVIDQPGEAVFDQFPRPIPHQAPHLPSATASSGDHHFDRSFTVQEFNYDNGVRQIAHTTEPCDICEVLPNDNYWSISKRAYGTARYFSALALFNQHRIPDPKKMRPGMKILIPEAATLESKYPELFRDYETKSKLPSGYFVQDDGTPAYRIGERETLSEIAQKHLGRSSRWIQIYRLNRSTLPDPNKLKPGSVIILPDDATNVNVLP
ncbi:MAG: LysM domain-containing protein [Planctomycetaceae bacterium]